MARFVAGATGPERFPRPSSPEIAFAGRSNVGKSSLLNRLVGSHKLARVSKTPGRTQQINFFSVDDRLTFVDLPGYGFARVPLEIKHGWKSLVEGYLSTRRNLGAVVVLVDLRRGLQPDDVALLDFLRVIQVTALVAGTKSDKLARGARLQQARQLAEEAALHGAASVITSASSGDGIAELWKVIETFGASRRHHG